MSRFPLRTPADAPDAAKVSLTAVEKKVGFVPNLLRLLANAPAALEAYMSLSAINTRSSLTLAQREVIQLAASATNECEFCVAGHTAIALNAGLQEPTVEALRSSQPLPDPQLDALAQFTRAVISSRGHVEDRDLEAFRAAGFDDAAALEVVLGVSFATLCNFTNNMGQPPLNEQWEQHRWTKPENVSA
jgi:uncharacterized peroxidase-related enzyme